MEEGSEAGAAFFLRLRLGAATWSAGGSCGLTVEPGDPSAEDGSVVGATFLLRRCVRRPGVAVCSAEASSWLIVEMASSDNDTSFPSLAPMITDSAY